MNRKIKVCSMFATLVFVPAGANALGFEVLVPHRAVYDVKLKDASKRSGIKRMVGRIVYELRGNECDGVSLKYRFLTKVGTARDEFLSDQHTSTFESADGKKFDFNIKTFLNNQLEETTAGKALLSSGGLAVKLKKPKPKEFVFKQARFLSSFLVEMIDSARKGKHFLRADLYDGSDGGDATVLTSSVISNEKSVADATYLSAELVKQFRGQKAWSIAMSYFDKQPDASAENLPIYESSFLLFENGISTDLIMRYPDYTLEGKLVKLEKFAHEVCKKDG